MTTLEIILFVFLFLGSFELYGMIMKQKENINQLKDEINELKNPAEDDENPIEIADDLM
ncbi:MAG: hypothetical protein UV76_C0002G0137 [Candidatus Nomurabacteria bacterium GW2011_GWA2_43_15]|uniref:Uncharacterized protein n=1 Tax=Candidatus Nomurabacteria bacterium GW2011_GWA2_43_15 TaxID=1618738 RepID=A0A0G1GRD9_9BACT|nr:MAG: hypothetical protein UV76_C0002G0137 [Candidatus Nomurabacteria bacterium GW2011_GWA2_43_15]